MIFGSSSKRKRSEAENSQTPAYRNTLTPPSPNALPEDYRFNQVDPNSLPTFPLDTPNFVDNSTYLADRQGGQTDFENQGQPPSRHGIADFRPPDFEQPLNDFAAQGEAPSQESHVVGEEDSQLQICREMSQWGTDASSPTRMGQLDRGREVIEYHDGINSITILGEIFGQKHSKRLVRIVLKDPDPPQGKQRELSGLDDVDAEYLQRKGAFNLPPRQTCDKLLHLYFECVYPYAPILDRVEFLHDYESGNYSSFLMQSILANVVPYASSQLLLEAGFSDRLAAQKSFFSKAKLLYDLGSENGQLRILQGSLMLSSLYFSFALDKDYRFWLTNAVRIAINMGLHRNSIAKDLDLPTRKLFRRIWWVLYNRDILLAVSGLDNVRRLHDRDCDTAALTEADWGEEAIPEQFKHIIPPITRLQKIYLIENCKLACISGQFIQTFRTPGLVPSKAASQDLENALSAWRRSLPSEMHVESVQEWSASNIWILVLMAMSYRLECVFYRALRERYRTSADESVHRAARRQQSAMFELDTIIDRFVLHNVARFCPLSLTICASTVLAMHIETALSPTVGGNEKLIARTHIHSGLSYLRDTCEYWTSMKWTLRMFEVIVARTALSLTITDAPEFDVRSMNPFNNNNLPEADQDGSGDLFNVADGSDAFGTTMGRNAEEWLQDLLGSNFVGLFEDSASVSGQVVS